MGDVFYELYHWANYNVDLRKDLRIGKNIYFSIYADFRESYFASFFCHFLARRDVCRPSHRRFLSTEGCMVDQAFFYTHNVNNKTMRSIQMVLFVLFFFLFFYAQIIYSQNGRSSCDGELGCARTKCRGDNLQIVIHSVH